MDITRSSDDNCSFRPLILSYAAYNKVRVPAIVTIIAGILNLILAVILTYFYGFGEYGIAFAFIFALLLRNVVFVPWYAAKVQGVPPAVFFKPVIPSVLAFAGSYLHWIICCVHCNNSCIITLYFAYFWRDISHLFHHCYPRNSYYSGTGTHPLDFTTRLFKDASTMVYMIFGFLYIFFEDPDNFYEYFITFTPYEV